MSSPIKKAMNYHLNRQAIKFYDADKNKADATHRMRLGVYWYQAQHDANLDAAEESEQ